MMCRRDGARLGSELEKAVVFISSTTWVDRRLTIGGPRERGIVLEGYKMRGRCVSRAYLIAGPRREACRAP